MLHEVRIKDAIEVFNTRSAKNTENYFRLKKKFDLDAGWQLLLSGEPEQAKNYLRNSDVDPRELILMIDDLRDALRPAINSHMRKKEGSQVPPKNLEQRYNVIRHKPGFNAQSKAMEARKTIREILEHLN